ncbi:uncharacterized protein LOC134825860 [Bolinopsis microptera]|uniref:uncharacterized protein LOC134823395 n=1 Tax=Bolinopsis microptera TaxID=2820187 RepID=UPI00307B0D18
MSSRLVYFGNVISRTDALAKANVIREPKWLKACLKFPPLSEPVNPVLPDWENTEQTKTHRVGNMTRLDGHRFDPKKPTEFPRDQQLTHPDQPYHIYYSRDELRRQFYSTHPNYPVHLSYSEHSESACEKWIKERKVADSRELAGSQDSLYSFEFESLDKNIWEEFEDIRYNCDISDIDIHDT